MKQFAIAAGLIAVASAVGKSACLYCRNQDSNSGFLVSYSYCDHTDVCLKDAWNYIQRECLNGWSRGNGLGLDSCAPDEVTCPGFESEPAVY